MAADLRPAGDVLRDMLAHEAFSPAATVAVAVGVVLTDIASAPGPGRPSRCASPGMGQHAARSTGASSWPRGDSAIPEP